MMCLLWVALESLCPTICGCPLCCAEVWLVGLAGCALPCLQSSLELEPSELTGDAEGVCGWGGGLDLSISQDSLGSK